MKDISWRQWNNAAFAESEQSGKLVLLSISAVWCHWCHVMDETTYSDPVVARLINERFIPIRVDSDRNPDINARYNMGGWPSTVLLTQNRDVLTGATYLPPDQMTAMLKRVADLYESEREDLMHKASDNRAQIEQRFMVSAARRPAARSDVENVLRTVRSAYDDEFGGFGFEQKFPHTDALRLLVLNYESRRDGDDLAMVTNTLDAMIAGEIFDTVEGGMFRYATRRDWSEPHYEKMLDDNARIVLVLLDAYRMTGNSAYFEQAAKVLGYIEAILSDGSSGLFFGSQDADEQYYALDTAGRAQRQAPRVDNAAYTDSNAALARAYLKYYGISGEPEPREAALRIVGYLNGLPRGEDGTVCHYVEDSQASQHGNLADSASLLLANIACHQATGAPDYIDTAQEIAHITGNAFLSGSGAMYDISAQRARQRGLNRYAIPLPENSALAQGLARLSYIVDDAAYLRSAQRILEDLSGQYGGYGIMAAEYAIATAMLISAPVVVTVNARPEVEDDERFLQASIGVCSDNCTVKPVRRETDDEATTAAVCVGSTCTALVTDPGDLQDELTEALAIRRAEPQ